MVAMFHRIRAYKRHAWILHKVEVQIVGENIQISWEGSLTGSDDDDKNVNGPYNIDHRIDPGSRDAGIGSPVTKSRSFSLNSALTCWLVLCAALCCFLSMLRVADAPSDREPKRLRCL
jgi:hypothetical protein